VTRQTVKSEIRDSVIRELLDKVRKKNYANYLLSIRLEKIRFFSGAQVDFHFPVTALVGPNGGGKSTILGAAACAYSSFNRDAFFTKSAVGDKSMDDWHIEHELIDRRRNAHGTIRQNILFQNNVWSGSVATDRVIRFFGLNRTVPASESYTFSHKSVLRMKNVASGKLSVAVEEIADINNIRTQAERILGKSLEYFRLYRLKMEKKKLVRTKGTTIIAYQMNDEGVKVPVLSEVKRKALTIYSKKLMFVGSDGQNEYSEFNFGAGEASIIRLVADAESLPDYSLILIEEIENGLHPVAVRRLVEYFIDIANRKKTQVIFTTHSDYALEPLPSEAIWASIDGKVQQGKLSIELLRVVSGRIDKRLAVFVEDEFAKTWLEAVLREEIGVHLDEIGIYAVSGDGNAVKTHLAQMVNPAILFNSVCFIDGDSEQKEDAANGIYRLPGETPESTIFDAVLGNLENNIALLTIACQRSSEKQGFVANEIKKVSIANRDPHLLFNQVGINIGFVPESIVKGAFLSVWIQENRNKAQEIGNIIKTALELPPKN
jgi:predicted ATPase